MSELDTATERQITTNGAAPAGPVAGARSLSTIPAQSSPLVGQLIVPESQRPTGIAAIASEVGLHSGEVADNFPTDPATRWRLDNLATTGASRPIEELVGQEIEVRFWRCSAVDIMDPKNGEVTRVPRTVLVSRDGLLFHAASIGVFQVVASLARTFGKDELPPGFKMRVAEIKTRLGHRMLTLQAV